MVTREPCNHDNGASDVWALTAYYNSQSPSFLSGQVLPCLHGDPIAGSNPDAGSDPSSGVALTRVYTVIPFTEQTPQLGQIGHELGVYITKFRALAYSYTCVRARMDTYVSVYMQYSFLNFGSSVTAANVYIDAVCIP